MGRPSKYKPEYCEAVIEVMKDGGSKEEACVAIGCTFHTFQNWQEKNPEFLQAVKEGEKASEAWWHRVGRRAVMGEVPGFNGTSYVFNMKNRFGWKDKQEVSGDSKAPLNIQLVRYGDDTDTGE